MCVRHRSATAPHGRVVLLEQTRPDGVADVANCRGRADEIGEENRRQQRVRSSYGPLNYARLVALKRKYDPTNFFRLNQNIAPSA